MNCRRRMLLIAIVFALTAGMAPLFPPGAGHNPPELQAAGAHSGREERFARNASSAIRPQTSGDIKVTVLFFNDLHGNLNPFKIKKADGASMEVGGIARISALVKKIREENQKKGIKTFLLVAGDLLQGTPMSTVFRGKPDIEIFNDMGVTAMTVGNHEFDFGLDAFLQLKKWAKFPIISSNIVWKESGKLLNEPSIALPLSDRVTLTVIGATTMTLPTTTAPANVAKVALLDSISTVTENFTGAVSRGPVILLSHSGFHTDCAIAGANPGLAAIIGGHDHLFLDPYKIVSGVPLFQAGEHGRYLGRLDLSYDPKTKKAAVDHAAYIPITAELKEDPAVVKGLADYSAQLDATFRQVVGESLVFMDGERGRVRHEETNLGDFVADVMRESTGSDVALLNAGSLRSSLEKGPVTREALFKVMPYPNEIVMVKLTGAEILEALDRSVRGAREDADGGFLQVSGMKFRIRGKKAADVRIGGAALDTDKTYSVAMTDFIQTGGDGYRIFADKPATKTGLPLRELLVDFVRKKGKISAKAEGRIMRE